MAPNKITTAIRSSSDAIEPINENDFEEVERCTEENFEYPTVQQILEDDFDDDGEQLSNCAPCCYLPTSARMRAFKAKFPKADKKDKERAHRKFDRQLKRSQKRIKRKRKIDSEKEIRLMSLFRLYLSLFFSYHHELDFVIDPDYIEEFQQINDAKFNQMFTALRNFTVNIRFNAVDGLHTVLKSALDAEIIEQTPRNRNVTREMFNLSLPEAKRLSADVDTVPMKQTSWQVGAIRARKLLTDKIQYLIDWTPINGIRFKAHYVDEVDIYCEGEDSVIAEYEARRLKNSKDFIKRADLNIPIPKNLKNGDIIVHGLRSSYRFN